MQSRRAFWLAFIVALCGGFALVFPAGVVRAGTVITTCDDAHLRSAVAAGGTITFGCSGTITVTSAVAIGSGTITIDGLGQKVEIDGGGPSSDYAVFTISSNATLTLRNLTIANGHVSTSNSQVEAVVDSLGTLNVINCTFTGNTGNSTLSNRVGIATVINSTFTGNHEFDGGAIRARVRTILINDTIANNIADVAGGGIYAPGQLTMQNTILYNNSDSFGGGNLYSTSSVTDNGYNLVGAGSVHGYTFTNPTDRTGNPNLGALTDNGGSTQTLALGSGSDAQDKISNANYCNTSNALVLYDQRGATRPQTANGMCDIGAYEVGPIITLSPATIPATGTVGVAYGSTPFNASGGAGGYSFAVSGGPAGLAFASNSLGGTPTQAGTFQPLITATDTNSNTGSGIYGVTIAAAGTTTTASNQTVPDSTSNQSVTLSATVTSALTVGEGTVTFQVFTGGTQIGVSATSGTVANGAASASYTLPGGTLPGAYTITATYNPGADFVTSSDSTHILTVTPGPTTTLAVTNYPSPTTAGTAHSFTVTAQDALGATTPSYIGTIQFTSSDIRATLPTNYTFVSGNAGTHQFSATLVTAGAQSLTAQDTSSPGITGSQTSIQVNAAAPNAIAVTAGGGQSTIVNTPFATALQATVTDSFGNGVPSVSVTFSAPLTGASGTFASSATGNTNASGIVTAPTLTANTTAGTFTVTANLTSGPLATPASFALTNKPTAATTLTVAGYPSPAVAGTANPFTVAAFDQFGNAASSYTGTIHFTSADTLATLPANYTFVAGDAGVHQFSATFGAAGTWSIAATDTTTSAITGMQTSILITAVGTTTALTITPPSVAHGAPVTFTATVAPAVTTTLTTPSGTVAFTDSGAPLGSSALDGSGETSFATSALTVGVHHITATYTPTAPGPYATSQQTQDVTVTAAPLVSITVTPASPALKVGQVQQFTATGTYADNSTADLTSTVTWSSDAATIVRVDATGSATGMSPGSVHLTAALGGVSGQTGVTVSSATSGGIAPAPAPASRPGSTTGKPDATTTPAPAPAPTGR